MPTTFVSRSFKLPGPVTLAFVLVVACCNLSFAQWHQWGGPDRNFSVKASGLAESWPDDGPKRLWERPLGEGYSTIVADGPALFTQYRTDVDEFVVALNAKTGETIWQHKTATPLTDNRKSYGPGPYATPLIVGHRLITVGSNSLLLCLDKKSGKVIWSHDLIKEYDGMIQGFGFSSSPIAYGKTIILPVGREPADQGKQEKESSDKIQDQSLMAFDIESGSLVWENRGYGTTKYCSTYSSPILINFGGRDHLVLFMATELAGLDPTSGERLWGVAHTTKYDENVSTPVWDGVDTIFCSSAYGVGARGVKLSQVDGKTTAKEIWYTKKMRVLHGNAVLVDDHVYGSTGDFGPTFFAAIDLHSGKLAWRKRGFKKTTCLHADGKVIVLDEDGKLALTTVSPSDLKIHAECNLDLFGAWATPTLIGKTMYVRDRKKIMALDLG